MKPIAYEFVAVSDEGLQLRCPECGEVFVSTKDSIDCPECFGVSDEEAFDEDAIMEGRNPEIDPADDTSDIDPIDLYGREDEAYAMADNDPNPYEGTYSEE